MSYTEKRTLVYETYDDYVDKMFSMTEEDKKIDWILDIFNGHSEQESIMYDDENFLIVTDSKHFFDGKNQKKVHLLVLCKDLNLRTMRDLRGKHVNMLMDIYKTSVGLMKKKFDISSKNVRCYFHYIPTNFALHIHVVYTDKYKTYTYNNVDLLETIENLNNDPNYFVNNDIPTLVGEKPTFEKKTFEKPTFEKKTYKKK